MTLRKIVKALPVLQKLTRHEFSVAQLYRVTKLVKAVDAELTIYYASRKELIDRHCEKDGEKLKYKDGTGVDFNRELQELLDVEVELGVKPLVLTERDNIRLTLADMDALDGFIELKVDDGEEGT